MPIMDGLTMLERLVATPELKSIPVVMLTAEGQKAAALGSRGYLMKPFTADALTKHVASIVPLAEKAGAPAL